MASDTVKFIGFMLNICLVASQGLWPRQVSTPGTSEPPSSAGNPTPLDFDQGPEQNSKGFLGVNLPKETPKSGGSVKFLDGMDLLDGLDFLGSYKKDSYSSPYLRSTLPYQVLYPMFVCLCYQSVSWILAGPCLNKPCNHFGVTFADF
jgi:hypothetical protein